MARISQIMIYNRMQTVKMMQCALNMYFLQRNYKLPAYIHAVHVTYKKILPVSLWLWGQLIL
jgi:hypothetical protein